MDVTPQDLTETELAGITWRVSRHSSAAPDCVEVGPLNDGSGRVAIRHSHHPDGEVIIYTAREWAVFTASVREGQFDFH